MSIPSPFLRLVDDAAIFPPGLAPLPDAVTAHVDHLASEHADLVGPFVVDAARLPALAAVAPAGLAVSVVVPDAAAVPGVLAGLGDLTLASLEVASGEPVPGEQPVYLEAPRPTDPRWPEVLEAARLGGHRLKFRTGGTVATAFPSEGEVAAWIVGAVAAGVPFKCTAGLHHAVRHTGAETGFEHHGYLNILLATARAGEGAAVVEPVLAERDGQALAAALEDLSDATLARARTSFTSYGSCSILEPLEDLTALHLI